jgi:two-component system, cell cycle response regulator
MGSAKKILIVEDNEINQDMLGRRLLRRGYEILLANNGAEGCSLALSAQPDLILMDMSLPVMDGWEATRKLKADERTASIPIMALTAHAMVGDLEKAMTAGCDDYHTKPIDLPQLLQKMEALLAKFPVVRPAVIEERATLAVESQPRATAAKASPEKADSARLLVVDDNEANRDMLSRRLERAGYAILLAESGEEALDILQQQPVDLVLLDIMMPGISGLDTLKSIREMHSKAQLPVLMATAKDGSDDIVQAFELGANDYITKPIDFPVALARIQSQLKTIEAVRQESIATPAAPELNGALASQTFTPLQRYQMVELFVRDEFSQIYLARDTQEPIDRFYLRDRATDVR